MRRTKIICTMGPATHSEKMIVNLINAGMDVARLNFSHGSHEEHQQVIETIRRAAAKLKKPVTLLQDLQGPKLRVGEFENGSIHLQTGNTVQLTIKNQLGNETVIPVTYKHLPKDIKVNDRILLDDGLIQLRAKQLQGDTIICEVIEGGILSNHKGINLPGVTISQPSFTEKDREDLLFGIAYGVDWVAMSFVRSAQDIQQVKEIIASKKSDILVIAKIEKPEAIDHFPQILDVADGIMIARGDLGVELPLEKVPALQKEIISAVITEGKPVITATQMLESMREHARPTRAEVSDVANAIFDGSDAVMLSAETAVGNFPLETVETMARIIEEAEQTPNQITPKNFNHHGKKISIPDAISCAACEAAEKLKARAIIAFTISGFTARMVAKCRPNIPIISFSPSEIVQHQLNLLWGVTPLKMDFMDSTQDIVRRSEKILLEKSLVNQGDTVIILLGVPVFARGTTNMMKLHIIGEEYNDAQR